MNARALALGAILLLSASVGSAAQLIAGIQIFINETATTVRSNADATYYPDSALFPGQMGSEPLSGRHWIRQTIPAMEFGTPVSGAGHYIGTIEGPVLANACYFARIHVEAADLIRDVGTNLRCAPGSNSDQDGQSTCVETEWFACPPDGSTYDDNADECIWFACEHSPIIVSLASGGRYDLTSLADGVRFDLDADGTANRVSWTAAGAPLAFVALDRNHNGRIDDGAELFGNSTPTGSGTASHGFEALAQYDRNGDGRVDAGDPVWRDLLLWRDANHDGVSQPTELTSIANSEISSLGTRYHWTGGRDTHGNAYRWQAKLARTHGMQPYYDIYLRIEK